MSEHSFILVLGAGELGIQILRGLAEFQSPEAHLAVLLRPDLSTSASPTKTQQRSVIKSLGASILNYDIAEHTSSELARIFSLYDTIISCTGFAAGPGTQLKLAKAVLEAGVKRYFPWQFGVDYDVIGKGSAQNLFEEQIDIRELLRGQEGTEWVIISTGIFMSFLFEEWFGVFERKKEGAVVRALGSWENRVTVTAAEDIGRLTAKVVFATPRISNQVVFVAGDTVSYARLAEVVEKVIDRDVKREIWNTETLKEELSKDPDNLVKKYRVVFAEGKGVAWDVRGTFNEENRMTVVGLEEWARANMK